MTSGPDTPEPASSPAAAGRLAVALADLAGMIRFFSRLPVPRLSAADDPAALPDFSRAVRLLPLAGLVIALPSAAVLALLGASALPPLAVAGLALAAGLLATGALHEDGLADCADGFGGGASRERKLEIMRDSRIGAYGAAALATGLLLRASLLAALLDRLGPTGAALACLGLAGLSRMAAVALMAALPPARRDGAGHAAGALPWDTVGAGLALAGGLTLLLAGPVAGLAAAGLAILLAGATAAGMAALARRQIGGQTGDVIGATQQVAEIAALVGLVLAH